MKNLLCYITIIPLGYINVIVLHLLHNFVMLQSIIM